VGHFPSAPSAYSAVKTLFYKPTSIRDLGSR
jgi:hypothetical protein